HLANPGTAGEPLRLRDDVAELSLDAGVEGELAVGGDLPLERRWVGFRRRRPAGDLLDRQHRADVPLGLPPAEEGALLGEQPGPERRGPTRRERHVGRDDLQVGWLALASGLLRLPVLGPALAPGALAANAERLGAGAEVDPAIGDGDGAVQLRVNGVAGLR